MTLHVGPSVWLESGGHLTQAQFHRRYLARPDIRKAELVEGKYVRVEPDASCLIERANFVGLRLHVDYVLAGNMEAVLAAPRAPDGSDQS